MLGHRWVAAGIGLAGGWMHMNGEEGRPIEQEGESRSGERRLPMREGRDGSIGILRLTSGYYEISELVRPTRSIALTLAAENALDRLSSRATV